VRSISRAVVVEAFLKHKAALRSNTKTNGQRLFLFGNEIAHWRDENHISITLAHWNTVTTRERLNAIPGVWITSEKGQLILNGNLWDGSWAKIKVDV
jgi:hypothetical protein